MKRSVFITTLGAIPGWPVIERIAHEEGCEPAYHARLAQQRRTTSTIQVTLSGQGETDGRPIAVGSALVMDGATHHGLSYRAIGAWEFFYVNLNGAGPMIASLVAAHGHVLPFPHRHPILQRWLGQLPRRGDGHQSLAFNESHRLAIEFLCMLTQMPADKGSLTQRALTVMVRKWDRNIGLQEIARELGVSAEHLSRSFHRATGETPGAWYRRHRLERAADMLRTSDDTVQDIAQRCGYATPAYFIAAFRTAWGMTPARWRAALRR